MIYSTPTYEISVSRNHTWSDDASERVEAFDTFNDQMSGTIGSIKEQGHIHGMLGDSEYHLDVPLPYDISKGDSSWSGCVHYLDLPAYGDTKEEVIEDLHRAIVEYYEILCHQKEDDLGNIPKIHKIILSGIVQKRSM